MEASEFSTLLDVGFLWGTERASLGDETSEFNTRRWVGSRVPYSGTRGGLNTRKETTRNQLTNHPPELSPPFRSH